VAELREEMTRARVAAVMAGSRATWAKKIVQERVVLLASTHGEADLVARKASLLEGGLVATRQDWDEAEAKLLSLVDTAATTDQ
jgi:hypothetical protein